MVLDLDLCTIRPWTLADGPDLVKFANNKAIWQNLRNRFPHPYTETDAKHYISASAEQHPVSNFAIEVNQVAAGSITFILKDDVYSRAIEIGYWLAEPFWGRGIATCAVKGLVKHLLEKYDPIKIYAGCFDWNKASGRVLEKAGFTFEARLKDHIYKDGRVGDELVYAYYTKR